MTNTHIGKVSPAVFENEKSFMEDHLEISAREFLAALQRMLSIKIDHSNPKLTYNGRFNQLDELDFSRVKSELVAKNIEYFEYKKEESNEFFLSDLDENGVSILIIDRLRENIFLSL